MSRNIMLVKTFVAFAATLALPALAATDATLELAGNAFITTAPIGSSELITREGLANWSDKGTVTSTYFHVAAAPNCSRKCPTPVTLWLNARLAGSTRSKVRVSVNGTPFEVTLDSAATKAYPIGTVTVPAGYVKLDLQGISKDGGYFGDVSSFRVTADATLAYANNSSDYHFSRRGPSVHMGYTVPANTEYVYNEMTVSAGQDPIGSYYMANGFDGGYFGMQVKSPSERWVLFSVWDADNGAKTTLVSKGAGVVDNAFGHEGSGGQTYLSYNWITGNTYRFVTRAQPDSAGNTSYSAWFFAPETGVWRYIATWKRPSKATYMTGVYSFLENFTEPNGHLERSVNLSNQWARSSSGTWSELTSARYTGDATVTNRQRMDYAGGVRNGVFYLRNGGFFSDLVPVNQTFTRPASGTAPAVDVKTLPMQ